MHGDDWESVVDADTEAIIAHAENIVAKLTAKDDKYACALADKIVSESQETDEWYEYFDDFASLLDHPKSLVRNRKDFDEKHFIVISKCNKNIAKTVVKKHNSFFMFEIR